MLAVFCFQLGGELSLLLYPPFPSLSLPPRYMIDLLAKCVCVWLLLLGCYRHSARMSTVGCPAP